MSGRLDWGVPGLIRGSKVDIIVYAQLQAIFSKWIWAEKRKNRGKEERKGGREEGKERQERKRARALLFLRAELILLLKILSF